MSHKNPFTKTHAAFNDIVDSQVLTAYFMANNILAIDNFVEFLNVFGRMYTIHDRALRKNVPSL